MIEAVRGTIAELPVLSFTAEMAAYKSLPAFQGFLEPPVQTRADLTLAAAVETWAVRAQGTVRGLAAWQRSAELRQGDVLDQLAQVPALIHDAQTVARDGADLAAQVAAANSARHEAGDEWVHGSTSNKFVAAHESDATRALDRHRRSMAGLPPVTHPRSGNR
jgi:hypothetical protein